MSLHDSMARPAHRLQWWIALLSASFVFGPGALTAAPTPDGPKLVQQFCYECHGEGAKKGKIDLEKMLEPANLKAQEREWEKAWKIVRHGFMPPIDAEQPTAAERKAITDWIAKQVFKVDFENPDPGRVTIRRLNRVEYENSVQDLFGYNFAAEASYSSDGAGAVLRLRDRLPPDDTAFGFDNIGDFQTVSPALLERYFDIADFVVSRVVQDAPRSPEMNLSDAVTSVKSPTNTAARLVTHKVPFEAKHAGEYRIDVVFTLGGWNDYGGGHDFVLRLNERQLTNDFVEIGGYERFLYTNHVSLDAGKHSLTFTTDARKPDFKGVTNHLELRPKIVVTGPLAPEFAEYSEAHRNIFLSRSLLKGTGLTGTNALSTPLTRPIGHPLPLGGGEGRGEGAASTTSQTTHAREILESIATRAFRRPVDKETLDGLVRITMRNSVFERGIAQALTAILTSPKFFFRAETQPRPDDPKTIHPLDEFALASRLSYLLWVSIPDEELMQLAHEGKLRANLRAQVKRMLADKKSNRFFEDFPGQWLRTRNVLMTAISRDMEVNPVRGAMKRETEMLFEHIARNDRDLIELITADYSFMNKALAEFYGLTNLAKGDFEKVSLKAETRRGGILTHGSFLVASSNPNRTSPVKRGLFVLENLLAVEPPPPPPDIPPLDDAKVSGETPRTIRAQLAAHRENKACAACHAHFDPIGVVLENYDLVGRWRTKENGEAIEAREKAVTGETLSGIDDLRNYFGARKEKFYHGATEKLLTYALGRGLEPYDAVTVDRVSAAVANDGGKFSTMLLGVIESPAFQTRRGDDGQAKDSPRLAIPATPPPEKRRPQRRFRNREFFEGTNAAPAQTTNAVERRAE